MRHKKLCTICKGQFESYQPHAKYCPKCKDRGYSAWVGRRWGEKNGHPCPDCGKQIYPKSQYCRPCSQKRIGKQRMGLNNPRWKGGAWYDCDGYRRLLRRGDHRADVRGYVYEHRVVWEDAHGQLPEGYVIHHLNGIKHDNRLCNLIAHSRGKHHYALHLQSLQKRIRELEAKLSQQKF